MNIVLLFMFQWYSSNKLHPQYYICIVFNAVSQVIINLNTRRETFKGESALHWENIMHRETVIKVM